MKKYLLLIPIILLVACNNIPPVDEWEDIYDKFKPTPTPQPTPQPTPEPPEPPKEPEEKPYTRKIVMYRSGFLWKPIAESNKRLVILLPSSLTGRATLVIILNKKGEIVERIGKHTIGNGNRSHWWASMPGIKYGNDLRVRAFIGGDLAGEWAILEGGARIE